MILNFFHSSLAVCQYRLWETERNGLVARRHYYCIWESPSQVVFKETEFTTQVDQVRHELGTDGLQFVVHVCSGWYGYFYNRSWRPMACALLRVSWIIKVILFTVEWLCWLLSDRFLQRLIYTVGDWLGYRIGLRFLTQCLHCLHVRIAQTHIPTPYFCIGQESDSESVPESVSSNVNEP